LSKTFPLCARSGYGGSASTRLVAPLALDGVNTFRLAGVDVPRIGLGTNRLTTAPEHVAFVREAVAAGVRHIDSAHLYTGGESERAIGQALEGAAEDVLVATKSGYREGEGRPEVLGAQIEQSLRSLGTETIGLYYLYRASGLMPIRRMRRPQWTRSTADSLCGACRCCL
jgi:aryl-alcohol dehydrogenase-like predicted oxidoreductase